MTENASCLWGLYVITDTGIARRTHLEIVREALAGGARVIQLRDKEAAASDLPEIARAVRRLTREAGACLIINDDPELARTVDADGVHVGQEDLDPGQVRAVVGPQRLIGLSTHNLDQARAAMQAPVDYIGVGPIYGTTTKQSLWPATGPELVRAVKKEVSLPVVAIGGITLNRIPEVVCAGADNIAVIGDLMNAPDIAARVRELARTIEQAHLQRTSR